MSGWIVRIGCASVAVGMLLAGPPLRAQTAPSATAPAAQAAAPRDALGRDTPRGALLGFMDASRNSREEVMPLYLSTTLRGRAAFDLAHQLFVVLDNRLPPRLREVSDRPEGSLPNPLKPDHDVIGVIQTANGPLEIAVERQRRGSAPPVWLFSKATLEAIPDVFAEIDLVSVDRFLPSFLTRPRIGGIRLFQWLAVLVLVPLAYRVTGWTGRLIRPLLVAWRRWRRSVAQTPVKVMPGALRLLLTAFAILWMRATIQLPLIERQFWSIIAVVLIISALTWALLLMNGVLERQLYRHLRGAGHGEVAAMLRLLRRVGDALVLAAAVLVTMRIFGADPTAALAGLGIGGIAVALAAQKTLENVVGGVSIIVDKAVRVGDTLKLGDVVGTVDDIGLRSTRIRTMDRTILSVPNGQIANVNIETMSARDKFWFHHVVGVRYETTSGQVRAVIDGIRSYLGAHRLIDRGEAIRARFIRFGPSSLDIEVVAYILAPDWDGFLETQQELLLEIMAIVERCGATLALPSQVLHLEESPAFPTARAIRAGSP